MFKSQLTAAQKQAKQTEKDRNKAARHAASARLAADREAQRKARFDTFPEFVIREVREVRVKAENLPDAISLASAAFKEGQRTDHSIKWGKPFGMEGDTIEPVRVVNIKVAEG